MAHPDQATIANYLLSNLTADDFSALAPHLKPFELRRHTKFIRPRLAFEHVYFPETGICSVVGHADGDLAEIGIIGKDGMAGTAILVGSDQTPHEYVGQVSGFGHVIRADELGPILEARPAIYRHFVKYLYAFSIQAGSTALANGLYSVEARLARWLLMSQDRVGDQMELTHQFLSVMLAIRRPSVTLAIQDVQASGAIATARGLITVVKRERLIELAGKCYGEAEAEYRRLFQTV